MKDTAVPVLSESSTVFNILSPAGRIQFPHIAAPDTKYDRTGFWSLKLNVVASDAAPLLRAIRYGVAQALKGRPEDTERASLPYTHEGDDSYTFTVKAKAWLKAERPRVFNAAGWPVAPSLVKHSSLGRVRFVLIPFFSTRAGAGVTLRLQEVHLVEESR